MPSIKRQAIRAAIHFPVGVLQGFACEVSWTAALIFCLGFLTYEVIEDWRIKDKSFLDLSGYLYGLGAYVILRLFW